MGEKEDIEEVLAQLRRLGRGEDPGRGRDEVAPAVRVVTGGFHGRALDCRATQAGDGYRLVGGTGEIAVRMEAKGEFIFPYGAVTIVAPDRTRGAAFVDAMADWLGTPMDEERSIRADAPVVPLGGDYARLAVRDDADGIRWSSYKLMLDGDEPSEVFLRITEDGTRAAFTEKWSAYRERLLVELDRRLGGGRKTAARKHVDVMGGASLTVRPDWIVTPKPSHITITDPADEASFEISHQPFPLDPRLPPLRARLDAALAHVTEREAAIARAVVFDRGDAEIAWTEYAYEATGTKSGEKRGARARILLAANDALQVLVTFAFWPSDASWAIPEWERMISALRLARPSTRGEPVAGR